MAVIKGNHWQFYKNHKNPRSLPSLSSSCQLFLQFKSISTFINGSHLGWREDMSQTVLKVDKSEIILAQIGLMVSEKKILMHLWYKLATKIYKETNGRYVELLIAK